MAVRDPGEDAGTGTGENFEADDESEARVRSFERAARAGSDELAGVIEQNIQTLAGEFEERTMGLVRDLGKEINEALGSGGDVAKPQTFVRGAVFGAIVFAAGVLLGKRH